MGKLCRYCGNGGVGLEDDFHEKCADIWLKLTMATNQSSED